MEHLFNLILSLALLTQFAIPHSTASKITKESDMEIVRPSPMNDTLVFAHIVSETFLF